jgi:uncharacterized membrane protein YkvA (DUF1232 family)
MSVKARRHVWCLATSSFLTRPTLHHLDMQASSRYRPIARDRRGLLLGSVYSVNNPGQLSSRRLKNDIEVANGKGQEEDLTFIERLKTRASVLKREIFALYLATRDKRTPWYAKAFVACVVAYALSPIDLIPDPIPILGYVDDLLLLPLGIYLAVKMIPEPVLAECRQKAAAANTKLPRNWIAAAIIVALWIAISILFVSCVIRFANR